MAKELTPVASTFHATTTCPEPGDDRSAASVEAGLQKLTDNTKYVRDLAETGGAGVGIKRIRTVADEVALKALTGITAGDVAIVANYGLYFAKINDAGVQEPFEFASGGTPGIYWYVSGQFAFDDQLGTAIVVTDPLTEQLLRPDVVPNRIVGIETVNTTGVGVIANVSGVSYADAHASLVLTLAAAQNGDTVLFDVSFDIDPNSCTGGLVRLAESQAGGARGLVGGTERRITGATLGCVSMTGVISMAANGLVLAVQGMVTAGDYDIYSSATMRAMIIRP